MKTICVNIIISIDKMANNIFTYCHLRDLLGDSSSLSNFVIFVKSLEHVDLITSKHQTHKQYKIQTAGHNSTLDPDVILKKTMLQTYMQAVSIFGGNYEV